jgi:glucosamine--fructose-6-phosphate aminotransferase (isomerizing)
VPGERMAAEMAEQPAVLARLAARREELVGRVRAVLPPELTGIVLVARGSSDHAAVYGRYVLEAAARRPVALAAPSLHTLYGVGTDYRGYLAVGVSQSGRTPEVVSVLRAARAGGARTVAVTNQADSPLARAADALVDLGAGEERAVPATKTFTAQVAALAVVAEALGPVPWDPEAWPGVARAVGRVLADPGPAARVAEELAGADGLLTVARGYLFCVALEAALKVREAGGMPAQGYSAADLRHGPVAAVEPGVPVVGFVSPGPAAADVEDLLAALGRRGARVLRAGVDGGALPVPAGVPEPLLPIPMAVRAQQVARGVGLRRGLDPDAPPGLTKVTLTG